MSVPGIRAPGSSRLTTGDNGEVAAGSTGEFADLLPPDDAAPITLCLQIVGSGPGVIRVYRCSPPGFDGQLHIPQIVVPDPVPDHEYTLVFNYPIPRGGLRLRYENGAATAVVVALDWTYQSPGRR